jgi:hypothetical protein
MTERTIEIRLNFYSIPTDTLPDGFDSSMIWRLVVDGRRTLQATEISLLVKLCRKRSMGALISLGQPIDTTLPYTKGILSKYTQKTNHNPVLTV